MKPMCNNKYNPELYLHKLYVLISKYTVDALTRSEASAVGATGHNLRKDGA